ncbi:MAG: hypothetical protein NTW56_17320 [Alphaproteobacteria bacterium]|nr:hypothetical protein [Alphaproteobacteria bacterium]
MRRIAIALIAIAAIGGTAQAQTRDIAWQPQNTAELLAVHGHTGMMGLGAQLAQARLIRQQARQAPQRPTR